MGIFSLPGIGQNFTFFGVNPSTGFADTFYKGQANKRAEEEAANPTTKGDQINDYAKDVYMRTTNILPVYADQVKKEVGDWIASTNDLQKRYGKNFTNSQEFTTGYLGIIQKLQNYQSSSKQFNDDIDYTRKNPNKSQMEPALLTAVQENNYEKFVAANGNNNPFYQSGSKLNSLYRPEDAHKLIMYGLQPNQFNANIVKDGNGMINYEKTKESIAKDPVFMNRVQQIYGATPTINQNKTLLEFASDMVSFTQGNITTQVMQNAAKPAVSPQSTSQGTSLGNYFSNSKVTVTTSKGNTLTFTPQLKPDPTLKSSLSAELEKDNDKGGALFKRYIKEGYDEKQIRDFANGKTEFITSKTPTTWDVGDIYNISYSGADSKIQNYVSLGNGIVVNGTTGQREKVNDLTGTLQGVLERKMGGKSVLYAIIKKEDTTKKEDNDKIAKVIPGEINYVKYDDNIASQIQAQTTDPKTGLGFRIGKNNIVPSTTKTPAAVTNQGAAPANQKLGPGQSRKNVTYTKLYKNSTYNGKTINVGIAADGKYYNSDTGEELK